MITKDSFSFPKPRYGVFPYDPQDNYPPDKAVRLYKAFHAALRLATALNVVKNTNGTMPEGGYVVRQVFTCTE